MTQMSSTMAYVLGETIEHGGELVRHIGGYWSWRGCPRRSHDGVPEWYAGTSTVQALVDRKQLEYSEWKEGRKVTFPVAARVTKQATEIT